MQGLVHVISPAKVVGKAHWYSDKLTVQGMVPWRHTMDRIPAGAKCEWWWARATKLIKTLCQPTVGVGPSHGQVGQAVHTPPYPPPFLNPPPGSGFYFVHVNCFFARNDVRTLSSAKLGALLANLANCCTCLEHTVHDRLSTMAGWRT
jgi:hypothetical protein